MKERVSESHFRSETIKIDADYYAVHLDSLLALSAWKELVTAFSFNMQAGASDQPDNAYSLLDGPIPLDPSIDAESLYRLGIIDKSYSGVSKFGKYVLQSLSIDADELAHGRFLVRRHDN
jgi:hypothetical protein